MRESKTKRPIMDRPSEETDTADGQIDMGQIWFQWLKHEERKIEARRRKQAEGKIGKLQNMKVKQNPE